VKSYTVVFTPEAEEQLAALYRTIAVAASPNIAQRYMSAIITYCEGFRTFPHRGTRRDDIRPGLRITNYKGRVVIAFEVDAERVSIIGVFYGGRDYETRLQSDLDDLADGDSPSPAQSS
jgi:plasmid stabilization system protein ParE